MKRFGLIAVGLALAMAAGCKADVGADTSEPLRVSALFDSTNGIIPLPNDLAKASTGSIGTSVDYTLDDGTPKTVNTQNPTMKAFIDNYLNMAPGFPVDMPLSVKFSSGDIDETTLTGKAVRLFDVSATVAGLQQVAAGTITIADVTPPTEVKCLRYGDLHETATYSSDAALRPTLSYWEVSVSATKALAPGRMYIAFATTDILDTTGQPIVNSQAFSFIKAKESLLNEDGTAKYTMFQDNQAIDDAAAAMLESIRAGMAPLFDYFEALPEDPIARTDMAIAWTFTTWANQLTLDSTNGVIPLPSDLARDASTGAIAIPVERTILDENCEPQVVDSFPPAQKDLVENYLNKLDGWPQQYTISLPFTSDQVDLATLGGAVRVFDVTAMIAGTGLPGEVTGLSFGTSLLDYTTVSGVKVHQVSVNAPSPWLPGHKYFVFVTNDLKGPGGSVIAPPLPFAFIRGTNPVVEDGVNYSTAAMSDAMTLEGLRQMMAPVLAYFETATNDMKIARNDTLVAWPFTTSAGNEVVFDPSSGNIPFPNDLILAMGGIPAPEGAPANVVAMINELNKLHGFSTLGSATVAFTQPLDPASIAMTPSLLEVGLHPVVGLNVTDLDFASLAGEDVDPIAALLPLMDKVLTADVLDASTVNNQLVITPKSSHPFPQSSMFMFGLFAPDPGNEEVLGLSSKDGELPIHVSPVFYLIRSNKPLVDEDGHSQVPSSMNDATAAVLENIRQQYGLIFNVMESIDSELVSAIPRERFLGFFTFHTANVTADLEALATAQPAPTDGKGTLTDAASATEFFGDWPSDNIEKVCLNCSFDTAMILGQPTEAGPGHFQADDEGNPSFTLQTLPFWMTIPKASVVPGPYKVVVYQHSLKSKGADLVKFANDLAGAGFVTIAIDAPLHGEHPITGAPFFTADTFAVRDNMRQAALDADQLVKFIKNGLADIVGADAQLDTEKVYYVGVSLGAVLGGLTIGLVDDLDKIALVTPGGHMMRIFTETENTDFSQPLFDALSALGIEVGTAEFAQFIMMAQWSLDKADPVNWASSVVKAKEKVRVLMAAGDEFIPNATTEALAGALGLGEDQLLMYDDGTGEGAKMCHDWFLSGCDATDFPNLDQAGVSAAQAKARQDVIDFLTL